MLSMSRAPCGAVLLFAIVLSGCGLSPPRLGEVWEAQDINDNMILNIKHNIFCETIRSIRAVNENATQFGKAIPDDYGVQLQLTLTIAESSSLTPNVSYNRTLQDGSQSGVSIGQSWNVGLQGELSSTATRTDTTYTYWRVGSIAGQGKNEVPCNPEKWPVDRRGSSLLLMSDLGIERFLRENVKAADVLFSSIPTGSKKPDKVDVYSYDLKFAVVTTGGISPVFKLVSVSGAGMPILNLNRTRTHELLLTFGPTGPNGFQPSVISLNQHLNNQLNSSLNRRSGP